MQKIRLHLFLLLKLEIPINNDSRPRYQTKAFSVISPFSSLLVIHQRRNATFEG